MVCELFYFKLVVRVFAIIGFRLIKQTYGFYYDSAVIRESVFLRIKIIY